MSISKNFKFNEKDYKDLMKKIKDIGLNGRKVAAQAMYSAANHIGNESQTLVPVDTGVLRGSMDISRQKSFTQKTTTAVISYGGPAAPYALIQHENMEFEHPNGGQAKYLEQPFLEYTKNWPASFVETMESEAGFRTWTQGYE